MSTPSTHPESPFRAPIVHVVFVVNTHTQKRRMSVKKAGNDARVQLRCEEALPPPAVWDFRRLLYKHGQRTVLIRDLDDWYQGEITGACGRNLTISNVRPFVTPFGGIPSEPNSSPPAP